jgi:hypothetical protein
MKCHATVREKICKNGSSFILLMLYRGWAIEGGGGITMTTKFRAAMESELNQISKREMDLRG